MPRKLLYRTTGLDLDSASVERAVRGRMGALGLKTRRDYLARLSGAELQELIEHVVVPESWMFRDSEAFNAVAAFVRRRLAERPERAPRILSLPCAGGEEPYSVAMALRDAGIAPGACRIEGMDISAAAIARARAARYTRNAFRSQHLGFRDRHFKAEGQEYVLNPDIRAMVQFSQANLFELDLAANAGRYDVLLCRNLLIYFDDATTTRAIGALRTLLADDGILFAGYAEVPAYARRGFMSLALPGAFALQKQAASAAGVAPRRSTPPSWRHDRPVQRPSGRALQRPGTDKLLSLAQFQANSGDFPAATRSCQALLAADPACAGAYFVLGMVSECQGDSEAALRNWRRCLYLQPDHYEALCSLALLAEQSGDGVRARSFRARAARVFDDRMSVAA
ncbi:CheR family methyltransferase [Massilia horti]|nr:CheR family methyltransferase [Massilia horti]